MGVIVDLVQEITNAVACFKNQDEGAEVKENHGFHHFDFILKVSTIKFKTLSIINLVFLDFHHICPLNIAMDVEDSCVITHVQYKLFRVHVRKNKGRHKGGVKHSSDDTGSSVKFVSCELCLTHPLCLSLFLLT
ncbi:hypothetical protein HanXRQr2_Chr13g0617071 [Helianthus annuus]|uniref:Uncharacterized protein n=2 Tax=Helianthus annuus TaxID=4232 RepID=A0A9K3EMV3_HELAN|nr:hypothetical protein HanXRQr2_Chr13g0617071 [Helianthus annuus]